ncbi:hypothetical protein ccbrp13_13720 [Ktedonobacteria bacterium brp13]|nr:hypothetical protein ccbrp13_13720 [Ktedonobacteria bacterium brp13]
MRYQVETIKKHVQRLCSFGFLEVTAASTASTSGLVYEFAPYFRRLQEIKTAVLMPHQEGQS